MRALVPRPGVVVPAGPSAPEVQAVSVTRLTKRFGTVAAVRA